MVKLKRKVVTKKTEAVESPTFDFPRFYIKSVGGNYTIMHSLTHTYIEAVDTEEALKEKLAHWLEMSPEDFWDFMFDERYVKPSKQIGNMRGDTNGESEQDKWYAQAWKYYTILFYKENPELYEREEELDYRFIQQRLAARAVRVNKEYEETRKEREAAVKRYKEETENSRKPEAEGKVLKVKKKGKAKKRKVVAKKAVSFLDSNDPFA